MVGLVIVISAGILFYYEYLHYETMKPRTLDLRLCPDNTVLDSCSYSRPLYCTYDPDTEQLALVEDCSRCGCPAGTACTGLECEEINNTQAFPFTIFFVPLNYDPGDPRFVSRAQRIEEELSSRLGIPKPVFAVLEIPLDTDALCGIDLGTVSLYVEDWYRKRYGRLLPAPEAKDGIPVYRYRIFALDKLLQDIDECGCGFTYLYGDAIYLGGRECSKYPNVAGHELGHTFGLCDEYDTCIWESTDSLLGCRNTRPDALNSDCGERCCSLEGACCYGKYSDLGFNVMGSADLPEERGFNYETRTVIGDSLCRNFGICGGAG